MLKFCQFQGPPEVWRESLHDPQQSFVLEANRHPMTLHIFSLWLSSYHSYMHSIISNAVVNAYDSCEAQSFIKLSIPLEPDP